MCAADTTDHGATYIEQIFGERGILAQALPGYEQRLAQVRMAEKINEVIRNRTHLLVEGPCGVGKSMAYGVPAVAHAMSNKLRVIVATAGITLQEQLYYKDFPLLRRSLPWAFELALIKGRNNYYCHAKAAASLMLGLNRFSQADEDAIRNINLWATKTNTGDRTELGWEPSPKVWGAVSSSSDECDGITCPERHACFYNAAKSRAARANIIVTNYHYLFASIAAGGAALPACDILIMDEAHEVPHIAREFMGFSLNKQALQPVTRWLKDTGMSGLALDLSEAGEDFFTGLAAYAKRADYKIRLRTPIKQEHAAPLHAALDATVATARDYLNSLHDAAEDDAAGEGPSSERFHCMRVISAADLFARRLEEACGLRDDNKVYWIEERRRSVSLRAKPIVVSESLHANIWAEIPTVVATSATLTTGGQFQYIRSELGAPMAAMELAVDSPFDFSTQSMFIIPQGMPPPTDPEFAERAGDVIAATINLCGGRTLALFTSNKNMERAYERILQHDISTPVYRQNLDYGRQQLAQMFRDSPETSLLGVASFWVGLDVPGEALTALVIDKLPFPNMSDPLVDAINSRDKKSFFKYSLPNAIITLRQGIGRLIRSKSDFGIVILLDSRLLSARYARSVLASLPPMRSTVDLNDATTFINAKLHPNGAQTTAC